MKYIQDYFYIGDKANKFQRIATVEDFSNPKTKYVYDCNNGDKWEVSTRYGKPVTFVVMRNVTQPFGSVIFQVRDMEKHNMFTKRTKAELEEISK